MREYTIDRQHYEGFAVFSCSEDDGEWRLIPLTVPPYQEQKALLRSDTLLGWLHRRDACGYKGHD